MFPDEPLAPEKPLAKASKRLHDAQYPTVKPRPGPTVQKVRNTPSELARKARVEARRQEVVRLASQGVPNIHIAKELHVSTAAVANDLRSPKSLEELRALRDEIRSIIMERTGKGLMTGTLNVVEQAIKDGDAKNLELSTRAAVNLDKLTVSAAGEPQRVDVGGHVNVDVRALLASAFGVAPDGQLRP